MTGILRSAFLALVVLTLSGTAAAQKWRPELVPDLGFQFEAPDRLERLPLKLGDGDSSRRARLSAKDTSDLIRGIYVWACEVRVFHSKEIDPNDVKVPDHIPEEFKDAFRKYIANDSSRARTFKEWLDKFENAEIHVAGEEERGRGKRPDYKHWVWTVENGFGPVGITYYEASVYTFDDKEVVLLVEMPLEKDKPLRPKSRWAKLIRHVIKSGDVLEVEEEDDEDEGERDQFADTPERQAALAAAKANIAGLNGWDYFTTPNYIVLYAWDFEKRSERRKHLKRSRYYAERLEKMRELYIENYPLHESGTKAVMPDPASVPGLSGPITGAEASAEKEQTEARLADKSQELGKKPWSVFRLCATPEQFQKYGNSPPGVIGWYSPGSKELVVFLGGDDKDQLETVVYHEGWHQFADFYFHPPESEKHATLHRWFDEGTGDYFGSYRWGRRGWEYVGSKMRNDSCKQMVRREDYVPLKEIVRWPRSKFYSGNAPYYYAQAYAMMDFLRHGEEGRAKGWQERYGQILDIYRKVTLIKGDAELAVDLAFRNWTDQDWLDFEEAWKEWVGSSKFGG